MELPVITEIAEYFEEKIGYKIPPKTPFVGESFNVTRAGIHADGLLKDEEIYNIFDTGKILHRPPTVAVDAHSGLAGIAHWLNGYFRILNTPDAVSKQDPLVAGIKELVDREYQFGRNTTMSDAELVEMAKSVDAERFEQLLALRHRG